MPDTAVAPPAPLPRPGVGSGIGQLLRDPDHYEEINVIGNGKTPLFSYYVHKVHCTAQPAIVLLRKTLSK